MQEPEVRDVGGDDRRQLEDALMAVQKELGIERTSDFYIAATGRSNAEIEDWVTYYSAPDCHWRDMRLP